MPLLIKIILYHIIPAILIVYVGVGFMLFFFQKKYIYYPTDQNFASCRALADTELITASDTRAYYKNNGNALAVLYHGNAGSACDRAWYALEFFEPLGLSYLIVEYTGYSNDSNSPSADAIRVNVENIISFIEDSGHHELVIISESIGSGPASYHASLSAPSLLIYSTPFESLRRVAEEIYPLYPASLLLTEKFDNLEFVQYLDVPIHILYGADDEIISQAHAEDFYKKLNSSNKSFTLVPDVGHNDIYNSALWNQTVWKLLEDFHNISSK